MADERTLTIRILSAARHGAAPLLMVMFGLDQVLALSDLTIDMWTAILLLFLIQMQAVIALEREWGT